jgi:hypothetical protein
MKNHNRWILYAKLNFTLFLIYASFLFLITIVLADNRFEQELSYYIFLSILWLVVLVNGVSWAIIKKLKRIDKPIPFILKLLISMSMVSIILVLIYSLFAGTGSDIYILDNDTEESQENKKK